jgi:uncharacterized membrane protein YhaH (DUF805 family)
VHWYTDVIRRYTDFDGRSDRPEFWWFGLINVIVSLVLWAIGIAVFGFPTGELVAVVYGLVTLLRRWALSSVVCMTQTGRAGGS